MLLEFETENYKSFKDRVKFSMVPAPKQKGLDYSVFHKKIGKKDYKALSSAVVYGPNASGKTNIISAMQTFKNIILRGNINNSVSVLSPNVAENALELIPNNALKESKNVYFSLSFIHSEKVIKYSVLLDLGLFLDVNYSRTVIEEILEVNERIVYKRNNKIINFENLDYFSGFFFSGFIKNFKTIYPILQTSLKDTDLFLTNGFRAMVSSNLTDLISDYLKNYFETLYRADALRSFLVSNENFASDSNINQVAKSFGIGSNGLVYGKEKNNEGPPELYSLMTDGKIIPSEFFESHGTIRFINMFPLVAKALQNGSILIVDEFDSSIHPNAIMNIINIFHNDDINVNHAQFIFNTHNPLYLNNNLFRRDEIKFIDRDAETNFSKLYSLSDFGTKGTSARKGKDYMNNYFMDEYGAIKNIDFSNILTEMARNNNVRKEE